MIVGLGIDLVEISRINNSLEKFGEHFLKRLLHPDEMEFMPQGKNIAVNRLAEWTAGRFAAKEAAAKALGTGLAHGISLHDLRVTVCTSGKPVLTLHDKAAEIAKEHGNIAINLSLTHTAHTAGAVVVISLMP